MRRPFDFGRFTQELIGLPADEMVVRTRCEILSMEQIGLRDLWAEFERVFYIRKLNRLLEFLHRRQIPLDLMPKERTAYQKLAGTLLVSGAIPRELALALNAC